MSIDKNTIKEICKIAKIHLTNEEIEEIEKDLNPIVEYMDSMDELDLENVEPTYRVFDSINPFREDEVKESLNHEDVFANTENREGNYFKIKG
ncbi:Asp-tRNA(Asn)/Glu-tRNA(Gln) amidotransferase subunit GatC [Anaeromicrobium sediminis]|uniref:Aspartyl/glutamyl-tRNA(Asn/Gln) amidotransferase subunit C n=1 Tax=Anaeromicrobium sediminis TaxID=1478221 RepID=A0A267MG45_9FIRM|nr:Asp-tRNA(Asn)/Glu-tRNA(Gln) amidotransferase subunit GatC [Anaeromicrobium sediminis]PAB58551.1 Asp-tRNA(Asn)/Glu-tRNA(Gln) amidotransferase GatCAB subunit C [Anaeromicrobium sediminis]